MTSILAVAQKAFHSIAFYRELYKTPPQSIEEIPFISHIDLHRAHGVTALIDGNCEIQSALPAYRRNASRLPFTILEGEKEWRYRTIRLRSALRHLGCDTKDRLRFIVFADDLSGPFASDLSNCLAWERCECSIVFIGNKTELWVSESNFRGYDVAIITSASLQAERLATTFTGRMISVRHDGDSNLNDLNMDRLLISDEFFVIAAARCQEVRFAYNPNAISIELGPTGDCTACTHSDFSLFALVRYCLNVSYFDLVADENL